MEIIDCRGLDCPEPVLKTRNALEEHPSDNLEIITDNQVSRDNVIRFLQSKNLQPAWQDKEGSYLISVDLTAEHSGSEKVVDQKVDPATIDKHAKKPVLFISTDQLGTGSTDLGQLLMRNFIYTLTKGDKLPTAIVFMNSGVKLSITGSPVLEELKELENNEVKILVCGTCLDYYQLEEKHQVGLVSNMYDITDLLMNSERVITP